MIRRAHRIWLGWVDNYPIRTFLAVVFATTATAIILSAIFPTNPTCSF